MSSTTHRVFALVATIVVVLSVAWGFAIAGSPETRRLRRLDERRLDALRDIERQIQQWTRWEDDRLVLREPLPASLDALREELRLPTLEITDPKTGEPYGYRLLSETSYELKATFTFPREKSWQTFWNHAAGTQTFSIDVLDPPQ